jgi:hypothetical protein
VANPVEPFGFMRIKVDLPLSLPGRIRDGFGNGHDLFEKQDKGVHKQVSGLPRGFVD